MSRRFIGPLHKFITKPPRPKIFLINPVEWLPKKELTRVPVRQPGSQIWDIFAQRTITIEPRETVTLELGLGVRMRKGWCPVYLGQEIRARGCVIQGEGNVFKNTTEIVITILNESDSIVVINEGDPFCLVAHTQRIRPTV